MELTRVAQDLTFSWPTGIPHESDPAVHTTNSATVTVPYALEFDPVTGPWSAEFWLEPTSQDPVDFHTPISSLWNSDFGGHLSAGIFISTRAVPGPLIHSVAAGAAVFQRLP